MNRRDFLRNTLYASMAAGTGFGMGFPLPALSACPITDLPRTLVNVMLYGGADLRFLFMPAPSHFSAAYMDSLWAARRTLYSNSYNSYTEMFDNEYMLVNDPVSGLDFGIYKRCGWLKSEFEAGRVAVIANSFCSRNRRHDQSQLNANVGEPGYEQRLYDRDGWGGRLVERLDGLPNTVELSHEISVFGNGTAVGKRLGQVIHAQNTRDIALPNVDGGSKTSRRNILTRALKSYYQARGLEVETEKPAGWPYHLFFQHNSAFREFGDAVQARLDACGPLPAELAGLNLYSGHFEQQCRNLYDVCQVSDILNLRTLSMRYDGWDTHNNQSARIGNNLEDLFGAAGGLATAMQQISNLAYLSNPAQGQLVFFFSTDFGRQLRANGDRGTDHGRGVYSIVLGEYVAGGLYGEMFPERESNPDANGKIPLETSGADIEGLTSTERILAKACDWMQPGSGSAVFPGAGSSAIENGVNLNNLFA